MSETGRELAIFSSEDNHVVVEALKKYFELFDGFNVKTKCKITKIGDIKGEVLVFLPSVDYGSLTDIKISNDPQEGFNCLNLIQDRLENNSSFTLITNNHNGYFPLLYISPLDLTKYFISTRKPSCEENIGAIFKVFKDHPNHTVDFIEQPLTISNKTCLVSEVKKTILIVDDFLCDSKSALGWFFMKNLSNYGIKYGMNFLFATGPHSFFDKMHEMPADIIFVDIDYRLWNQSPDSSQVESIYYTLEGIDRVGWRIIDKIIKEHIEGRKDGIYELLPTIVVFTQHTIEKDKGGIKVVEEGKYKYKRKGYQYKENGNLRAISHLLDRPFSYNLLLCQKENKDRFLEILNNNNLSKDIELRTEEKATTRLSRTKLLKLRKFLRDVVREQSDKNKTFDIKIGKVTIKIDPGKNKNKIDVKQKEIMSRLDNYMEKLSKVSDTITLEENPEWSMKDPYKNISFKSDIRPNTIGSKKTEFCGIKLDNPILLAATPLTAIQHYNSSIGLKWYKDKIRMLLSTGVGGIILKTVYYNLDDHFGKKDDKKAGKIVQEKTRSRVFLRLGEEKTHYIRNTLYNTGDTKTENISFAETLNFLRENKDALPTDKIILSVGSKSYELKIWEAIFKKLTKIDNSLVEINARHTIREMLKDEDISEVFDEYVIYGKDHSLFYDSFKEWISNIHELAVKAKKKLLIKLPFRSDLIHLLHICDAKAKKHPYFGIKGITLINTIKAPYPFTRPDRENSTETIWHPGYIYPKDDVFGLPQLSGSALKYLRDWAVFQASRYIRNLDISASGGVEDFYDVNSCLSMGAKTVQLGTKLLMNDKDGIIKPINEILNGTVSEYRHPLYNLLQKKSHFVERFAVVNKEKCTMCLLCLNTYYCDAFKNRYHKEVREKVLEQLGTTSSTKIKIPLDKVIPDIDATLCHGCGLCVQVCGSNAIILKDELK